MRQLTCARARIPVMAALLALCRLGAVVVLLTQRGVMVSLGSRLALCAGACLAYALQAAAASSTLWSLGLRSTNIGPATAKAIGAALAAQGAAGNARGLAAIDLSLNHIGDEGAESLAAGVAAAGGWLRSLSVSERLRHRGSGTAAAARSGRAAAAQGS